MVHRCVKCGKIYDDDAEEILQGCECGGRFFYYISNEKIKDLEEHEIQETLLELEEEEKELIEKDIRDLIGLKEEDRPVILDLESVRVVAPGKFEIDLSNLFSKERPIIFKLGEGKYMIDLSSFQKKQQSSEQSDE